MLLSCFFAIDDQWVEPISEVLAPSERVQTPIFPKGSMLMGKIIFSPTRGLVLSCFFATDDQWVEPISEVLAGKLGFSEVLSDCRGDHWSSVKTVNN